MFNPGDLRRIIMSQIDRLVDLILQQKVDVSLSRTDSRIARSIEWLMDNQRPKGSWGINNVAVTSLVMIAFSNLLEPAEEWELEGKIKESLAKAEDFLLERYKSNRFENALWDTAIAVRALKRTGQHSHNFISERISWMLSLPASSVNAGPHHFAQKALTFAECGVQTQSIIQAAEEAWERVKNGKFRYSPYVLAQCLEALHNVELESRARPIVEKLLNFLETTHLDSANFINICTSLNALAPLKNPEIERRMRLSVASLFGETCFRDDGTWYHDEMLSAYALIALTRFSKEVIIRAPKSEIIYEVNNIASDLLNRCDDYSLKSWKWWVLLMSNSFVVGALLLFFITYTSLSTKMAEWLKWTLGSLISLSFGFTVQYAYRYYRKVKEDDLGC